MRRQCLLLSGERYRRRRRRSLCHHLPVHDRRGGCSDPNSSARHSRSDDARLCGSHSHPRADRRCCDLACVHYHGSSRHRLRAHERLLRNRRHRALHAAIHIGHVVDHRRVVNDRGVVNVRDLRDIHRRAADIHACHIPLAHVIRGHIDLARTEREPSHVAAKASRSSADEYHQRGRIDRTHRRRSGDPSPPSADGNPASVVEGRIAPRCIIDPCPSPGRNPRPVAVVIRSPAGFDVRIPDVSILRIVAPVAVFIEIVIADHVGRKILRRARILEAMVASLRPDIEIIRLVYRLDVGINLVVVIASAAECPALSAAQRKALPAAVGFAIAFTHADHGVISIIAGFEAIVPRLQCRKRQIRRIDFEVVVAPESPHGHIECARRELELDRVVVEIEEGKSGHRRQANDCRSQLHFRPRILIGPDRVAGRHRTVGHRAHPVIFSCGAKRN